ncbi:hypothetical protein SEND513_43 [Mycobacterium phage Send513]|uniref:Uncharacterized protein n=2 Tax=Papyrusvirus send513 TaxID=1982556 RepID=G1BRM1_9CAUD|nr:hypothetical protein FDI62_gp43 [Mycobacterium phage Send513]AEK07489.1 hypothetical protein SEND513_43 [Mycobacterium phage Send513]
MVTMFVETRTTADEVKAEMLHEVECLANHLLSQPQTVAWHPSYTTISSLQEDRARFSGAVRLVRRVYGDKFPDELEAKIVLAIEANEQAIQIKRRKR